MQDGTRININQAIRRALAELASDRRLVVAIVGIPGSGKSTLCASLADALNAHTPGFACVVPMDGFHLPNAVLDARGLRKRKGSPESFDLAGLTQLAGKLQASRDPVVFPIYDRALHEPVLRDAPGQRIEPHCRVVLIEGNYLLLDEPGWRDLARFWDLKLFLDVPIDSAREDVINRHVRGGRPLEDALAHYERNDRPNAVRVLEHMIAPDFVVGR